MWDSSSSEDEILVRRPRRRRSFRIRTNLNFVSLYEFNERFRMSSLKMELLLEDLGHRLRHETRRSNALSEKLQLCAALHWLGNGGQYHGISDMHGISKASVCRAVHAVVAAVNDIKFAQVIDWPNNTYDVTQRFFRLANMPLVIGCMDGILIEIDAPTQNEPQYIDRHGNHSLNIMAVCGPDCQFYYVSARWPGSINDARVYRNSTLHRRFEEGWRPIPGGFILGDSAYPLREWLLTPTDRNLNDPAVIRFNRAHKSTRRVVENAFGILKEKFPCLNHLRVNPLFACEIIKCCFTLCNIARTEDDVQRVFQFGDDVDINEVVNAEDEHLAGLRKLQEIIDLFR